MARSRRPQVSRGPRRLTTWVGPADQGFLAVAAGAKVIIGSFNPAVSGLPRPTIVRTRGEVGIRQAAGVTADSEIVGAYGLGIVSTRAFTAGVASIPGPFSDAAWDGWFVWRSFHYVQESADTSGIYLNIIRQEVDSKGMRKISDEETLVLVAESQATAFKISMPLRILFKLS